VRHLQVEIKPVIQATYEPKLTAEDPRDVPAYTSAEASRILSIPATTIRAWVRGQAYISKGRHRRLFNAVLDTSEHGGSALSYNQMIEAYTLRALRTVHKVELADVRRAVQEAEEAFGISRLLIHEDLRASAGEVFLKSYGTLISLGRGQQIALEEILRDFLWRIEYDETGLAVSFYPITTGVHGPRIILLDPRISFGRPVIESRGIRTAAIYSRIDAGEPLEHVAADYELTQEEVAEALRFEAAA
jgi:uncharacterized protein (DUF433 family)